MTLTAHIDTFARDNLPAPDAQPDFVFTLAEVQYPERINCVSRFLDRWVEEGHGDQDGGEKNQDIHAPRPRLFFA